MEAILSHPDSWKDALKNRTQLMDRDTLYCDTPLRKLIRFMPGFLKISFKNVQNILEDSVSDQALKVFSNCVKLSSSKADDENLEMTLLFEVSKFKSEP